MQFVLHGGGLLSAVREIACLCFYFLQYLALIRRRIGTFSYQTKNRYFLCTKTISIFFSVNDSNVHFVQEAKANNCFPHLYVVLNQNPSEVGTDLLLLTYYFIIRIITSTEKVYQWILAFSRWHYTSQRQ